MNLQAPSLPTQPQIPEIRDISAPVDVFPWPLWMVLVAAGVLLLLAGLLAFGLVAYLRRRPAGPPPSPRTMAMRELESLRPQIATLDPYEFSAKVSDVLRKFIEVQYGLRATHQTTPEFLASMSASSEFGEKDRELLEQFLERCDLLKFAHIEASSTDSAILHERAVAFVQGARA
ncbi:MAG TPA: DUF4381 family protein [Chthoniobacteraceae bacterium]|nr:DUF4381 family protein [Chthoniobacteraceae bacterium]